jgi:hypothetical protein
MMSLGLWGQRDREAPVVLSGVSLVSPDKILSANFTAPSANFGLLTKLSVCAQ